MKNNRARKRPAAIGPRYPGSRRSVLLKDTDWAGLAAKYAPLAVWAGWALAMWAILAYGNFNLAFNFSGPPKTPLDQIYNLLIVGFVLMALGYRFMPDRKLPDIGRGSAWILLVLFLGASGFLLFYSGDAPMGSFWNDWCQNVADARNLLDFNRHSPIFQPGGREGFHVYLIAAVWWLFPALRGLMVVRIASGLVVLATVWIAYLIGVEMGSRRRGLMLAALTAAGKLLLLHALSGMRIETQVLASAVAILMFLRTVRRPNIVHFLACGLALGLGVYTYTGFRSWVVILPFLTLLWAVTRKNELRAGWQAYVLPVLVLWLHLYYFIGRHMDQAMPLYSPAAVFWRDHAWLRLFFFLFLLAVLIKALKILRDKRAGVWTTGWSLGMLLMLLCLYPATLNSNFSQELTKSTIFVNSHFHDSPLGFLFYKIGVSFRALFFLGEDRDDLLLSGEPYLDYFSIAGVLLGLALLVGRPDRKGWLFFLLALLGFIPHVLLNDLASSRIIGAVLPLYVLGALGADRLLSGTAGLKPKPLVKILAVVVLFLLFGTGVWMQFQKFHVLWVNETGPNAALGRQVGQLARQGKRVYLTTPDCFWGAGAQAMINEGFVYYPLMPSNMIELEEGEPLPQVVLLANPGAVEDVRRLRREFPHASWVPVPRVSRVVGQSTPGQIVRVELSEKDLTEDPGRRIYIRRSTGKPWVRRYHSAEYGAYGRNYVLYEDRVGVMSAPLDEAPMKDGVYGVSGWLHTVRVFGKLKAERDGVYRLKWTPRRHVWVRVDGRTVADIAAKPDPKKDVDVSFRLKEGEHPVELGVHFGDDPEVPRVFLTRPGASSPEMF